MKTNTAELFSARGRRWGGVGFIAAVLIQLAVAQPPAWVGTWATALQAETADKNTPVLAGATLRQVVHASIGGDRVRVRLSNAFGREPLVCQGAHLALAAADGAIRPGTDRELRFSGRAACTIPPGAAFLSDPVELALPPQADVAISLLCEHVPSILTAHPGSRATSFVRPGGALAAATLSGATKPVHWYFISGMEVAETTHAAALIVLGDSITDGHGTTTDGNNRWPDDFVRLFQGRPDARPLGMLNLGIGGNRLLRDGTGPNALARFDRDVLTQAGARWLLVFEGINDIGTRLDARKKGTDYASAADLIAAYAQIIARARSHGLRVYGATITPYEGADFYWSADGEADRQAVNAWIRTSGQFDAVVDFDAALRDPAQPTRLAARYDSGDHLHPSLAGYAHLAESVDPRLFPR